MVKQSEADLKLHLQEQIELLIRSTELYDKGFTNEVKIMASRLLVLLHDTNKSVSLFKHLGKKDILFYNTADDPDPKNLAAHMGLINISVGPQGFEYTALLNKLPNINPKRRILF